MGFAHVYRRIECKVSICFRDANWAGDKDNRKSTSGGTMSVGWETLVEELEHGITHNSVVVGRGRVAHSGSVGFRGSGHTIDAR